MLSSVFSLALRLLFSTLAGDDGLPVPTTITGPQLDISICRRTFTTPSPHSSQLEFGRPSNCDEWGEGVVNVDYNEHFVMIPPHVLVIVARTHMLVNSDVLYTSSFVHQRVHQEWRRFTEGCLSVNAELVFPRTALYEIERQQKELCEREVKNTMIHIVMGSLFLR